MSRAIVKSRSVLCYRKDASRKIWPDIPEWVSKIFHFTELSGFLPDYRFRLNI